MKIGVKMTKVQFKRKLLRERMKDANFESMGHAARSIRRIAMNSLRKPPKKAKRKGSKVGSPPYSRTKRLKKAIVYAVDRHRESAVIGPSKRLIGLVGKAHEHGGKFRREVYPARPYMAPALKKAEPRIPKHWSSALAATA